MFLCFSHFFLIILCLFNINKVNDKGRALLFKQGLAALLGDMFKNKFAPVSCRLLHL